MIIEKAKELVEAKYILSECSCGDQECWCHPVRHRHGCIPCIETNRKNGTLPICFFYDENGEENGLYSSCRKCMETEETIE